ncbi:daunorubicin resistance protein DrrA family ABC transporter ATP-binding protein [Anaerolinea thermophila]|uniref:ABC transporter ATP-binding protein n=1 Tax=Anaerolinea thermophila (strain DSM 14523 / JCM 11388 / NBRC 100420 / UNI-1) TaxID=926569 RepID=E8MZT4_ANATU|nr:daunorubicin resistance protein DrrA family ABC transporter ATP-binding protein [Anaerolinea thermophila]BAJ62269.1 putative ABC transporter ATP-binding protein [Anaerolinea thermophila UNI-1]
MSDYAIEALDLVKKFPRRAPAESSAAPKNPLARLFQRPPKSEFTAVDHVSFQIHRGEIFGLLGPNGAGKSTTIRMLCTLLEPTSGTARINGYDVVRDANRVRQSLGIVLAGERSIYWKLTGRENLEYFAALYHIPPEIARKRIDELLDYMELTSRANELVEKYSTGMRQRIVLSRALLARPPIILLDEPTLGLDPQAARRIREMVLDLKRQGHTILLTTHYMEEADQLSDRIGIIDQGKIIALDTPAALKQRIRQQDVIKMEVAGWKPEMTGAIQSLPGIRQMVTRFLEQDGIWEIHLQTENSRAVLPHLIERVNTNGTHLVNLNIVAPTLEDVFIHLTGKALRD